MPEWVNFVISLAGAVGGLFTIGSFTVQLIERRERKLIEGSGRKRLPKTHIVGEAKEGFAISRTRVAVLTVFLLTSIGFSATGLVSSIRREEPLKTSLRPENIEATLHQWLDAFSITTQKNSTPDNPVMKFELVATLEKTDTRVVVFVRKDLDRYVVLQTAVIPGADLQTMLGKMSEGESAQIQNEFIGELAKAKLGYSITSPPLGVVTLIKRLPITNSLTEAAFMESIEDVELSNILARQVMASIIERHAGYKPKA